MSRSPTFTRILVAGASGVIGRRLLPELLGRGHQVLGLTRSPANARVIEQLGARALVCDVYDAPSLKAAFEEHAPEAVFHLLTDLPDNPERIGDFAAKNNRVRTEGTDNLLFACASAGVARIIAESVAWDLPGDGARAVAHLESAVLAMNGTVLRFGQLWGAGTFNRVKPMSGPTLEVELTGRLTVEFLDSPPGTYILADEEFKD